MFCLTCFSSDLYTDSFLKVCVFFLSFFVLDGGQCYVVWVSLCQGDLRNYPDPPAAVITNGHPQCSSLFLGTRMLILFRGALSPARNTHFFSLPCDWIGRATYFLWPMRMNWRLLLSWNRDRCFKLLLPGTGKYLGVQQPSWNHEETALRTRIYKLNVIEQMHRKSLDPNGSSEQRCQSASRFQVYRCLYVVFFFLYMYLHFTEQFYCDSDFLCTPCPPTCTTCSIINIPHQIVHLL